MVLRIKTPLFFLIPMLSVIGLIISPIFISFYISFTKSGRGIFDFNFSGFYAYEFILHETRFYNNIMTTLCVIIVSLAISYTVGLALALAFQKINKLNNFVRAALLAGYVMMPAAIAIVFKFIFDPYGGVYTILLSYFGYPATNPFLNTWSALGIIILAITWRKIPLAMIFLWSGLQSITPELYESARIDGAGKWGCFRYITLPLLKSTSLATILLLLLSGVYLVEFPLLLTGGGPAYSTETIILRLYQEAFNYLNWGYASAIGTVLIVVTMIILSPIVIGVLKYGK
jgi:ABC-type sugar transport system permease subunit